ncbi:hypothetical protein MXB_963 [Myxobolus squamalis]|nr:hypothetical protein MXB_963 [Myxobolus squamalis]
MSRECSLLFSHERSNHTFCNVSFDGSSPCNLIGPDNICKNVMLFDVRSHDSCIYECPDHGRLMVCRPIGDKLVLGGFEDGSIVVWAREKLQPLFEEKVCSFPGSHYLCETNQVVENVFVCGTFEPYLRVLKLLDSSTEKIFEEEIDSLVLSCVATNKDMVSVGGSSYGKIYLISNTGVTKCRINGQAINAIDTCDDKADLRMLVECGTQISKNYDYMFACGESDGSVSFWSTAEIS